MSNVRVTFQDELDQLEASLQEEGELVLRVLRGALNALGQGDVELADDVIAFDDDVDRHYIQIEEGIQSLLALQTPVATDLRLVLAMLHTNLHLERMADYAVTIAKLTKLVADVEGDPTLLQSLQEMGERAEEMIRVALDAFAKVRKRYEIPEFDPENLPTSDAYDWSWFVSDQSKTAVPAA
jgi:phosphate transport system protein